MTSKSSQWDWLSNLDFNPTLEYVQLFLFFSFFFFTSTESFLSHKNDKANSIMKSRIKWCQKTNLTFIGLLLIFPHPHVFAFREASLFCFLDTTLASSSQMFPGLQAALEVDALLSELLSVFYCLPVMKASYAYGILITSLPELGQIHVWFALDPREWKSVA